MRAKIRHTTACRKAQRSMQVRRERIARLRRHGETLIALRAQRVQAEQDGDTKEISRLNARIRTLEQQIRYIGEEYEL